MTENEGIVKAFLRQFHNVYIDRCQVTDIVSTLGEVTGVEIRVTYNKAVLIIDNNGASIDLSRFASLYPLGDIEFQKHLDDLHKVNQAFARFLVPSELNLTGQGWLTMMTNWVNLE